MKILRVPVMLICVLTLCGLLGQAPAEEWHIETDGLELMENSLAYPVLSGGKDEEALDRINEMIREETKIPDYLTRISQLISGGSLRVTWEGGVLGDIFSCAVSAEGALNTGRWEHAWTWATVDLAEERQVAWADLTGDEAALRGRIETLLEEKIAPELSDHLQSSELTPLPEGFRLTKPGLILLYPARQLSTLTEHAGSVRLAWSDLEEDLDLREGSVLERAGIDQQLRLDSASAEALRRMTEAGAFPDIPARLGDALQEITDRFPLLTDPDLYAGGRLFSLEGADFQQVQLLTDDLTRDWENSRVEGIRLNQGCVWGLRIGETAKEAWRAELGEPETTVTVTEEAAEQWRVPAGECDYYAWGEHRLCLYADEEGLLSCVLLQE